MKIIPRKTLLLFLVICFFPANAQKLRPEIQKLAKEIGSFDELTDDSAGFSMNAPPQYLLFIRLRKEATTEELLLLIKDKNPIVQGYAAWALADNKYEKVEDIFNYFIRTKAKVTTHKGCIVTSDDDLAMEFYFRLNYQKYANKLSDDDEKVFLKLTQKLDSIILYDHPTHELMYKAFENNNANPATYKRIRQLALEEKNKVALAELGKYRRIEDISSIKKEGEAAFLAIANFPDEAFRDFLLQYKSTNKTSEYFLALSSYKDEYSLKDINEIYKSSDIGEIADLDEALIKNYCLPYQNLLLTIWEDHNMIDLTATKKLIADCPEKAANSFSKGLGTKNKLYLREIDMNYGTKNSILPIMIENIAKYKPDVLPAICINQISISNFMEIACILDHVKKNNLTVTTTALLKRLEAPNNYPFEIFYASETLFSFKNDETDKKVMKILRSKRSSWDRGNWADGFRELFQKFHVSLDD